jgi:acetate kinase
MKPIDARILTINGGSSSIKFALFEAGGSLQRTLEGGIERIGLSDATFRAKGLKQEDNFSRSVAAPDHTAAVGMLMDWIEQRSGRDALTAVGHRVVHGGPKYSEPQRITEATDAFAAKAIALFCYQAKKYIGALAAVLGGLDSLVFTGGIGDHAAGVRVRICEGLEFLGAQIDPRRNEVHAPVISHGERGNRARNADR